MLENMRVLKPCISKQTKGQIWKLEIDQNAGMLYVQTRETENRQALLFGFDLNASASTFTDLAQPEKWLTGMEGSYAGVLFLHGYQSAKSPVHKGITAVEGQSGKTLWSNYTYAIENIGNNGPIAYNTQIQPKKLLLLNAHTGATIRAYNPSIDVDITSYTRFPSVSETLDNELKGLIQGQVVGNIHYIGHNSFRIVSLHTLFENVLSQVLLIIQAGNLVYYDLLNDKIQKLQPEAFIMHRNRLIYIKDKVELKVLNL
jgi:hypothetical protein